MQDTQNQDLNTEDPACEHLGIPAPCLSSVSHDFPFAIYRGVCVCGGWGVAFAFKMLIWIL